MVDSSTTIYVCENFSCKLPTNDWEVAKKYMKPNILNYILSAIGLLIIVLLPYWPYIISKVKAVAFLIFVNIFFTYYYYFHYKHSMF